jgi:hypothetical protein
LNVRQSAVSPELLRPDRSRQREDTRYRQDDGTGRCPRLPVFLVTIPAGAYFIAPNLHFSTHLKQVTLRLPSMLRFFTSMHEALQCRSHRPHFLHFPASNAGLKIEKRESNPSALPTGHTVLQ